MSDRAPSNANASAPRRLSAGLLSGDVNDDADPNGPGDSLLSRRLQILIQVLIIYSVVTVALETMPELAGYRQFFYYSELLCVIVFTAEYLVRWSLASPWWSFPLRPMSLIDLMAVLPFYLGAAVDLRTLRALRLLRIFRLLKLARYSKSLQMMGEAVRRSSSELLVFLFIAGIIVLLSAMGLYYAEHESQPDVYKSIPDSIWWAIVTLTTVGYGDVYPTTAIGRVIASIVMLTGIGFIAVPTSLISSTMTELAIERRKEREAEHAARQTAQVRQGPKSPRVYLGKAGLARLNGNDTGEGGTGNGGTGNGGTGNGGADQAGG